MAISDDFADATIRHQVYLQRYKSGVVKDILSLLTDVEDKVVADLIKSDLDKLPRRQLNRLLRQLKDKIRLGYEPVIALLNNEVEELAKYEKQWQMNLFGKLVPIDLDFVAPSDEQIIAGVISSQFQ